jgi:hypothetical protein
MMRESVAPDINHLMISTNQTPKNLIPIAKIIYANAKFLVIESNSKLQINCLKLST